MITIETLAAYFLSISAFQFVLVLIAIFMANKALKKPKVTMKGIVKELNELQIRPGNRNED